MNYIEVSKQILTYIGEEKNITNFTHCVTRLRFNVRDKSLVDVEKMNAIKGVIGSQWQGEQYQVIVGAEVEKLYSTICKIANFEKNETINENLDQDIVKEKVTFKWIIDKIFAYLSPMMSSLIPLIVAAGLCKVISYLFGPDMVGLMSADSGMYLLLDFIYDACFYFLPIYLGYVAGKVLNYNPVYGMFLGALIIVPDFVNLVGLQDKLNILCISVPVINYSSSFLPVVLGGVVCKYVLYFFEKHIPNVLNALLVPFLTVIVMSFVMLGVCAPLGSYIGTLLGMIFMAVATGNFVVRIIGRIAFSIIVPYMIMCGMHGWMFACSFALIEQYGYDPFIFSTGYLAHAAIYGIALGAALKLKNRDNKTLAFNYFLTGSLGGITEPILYGVLARYKNSSKGLITACAVAGLLGGIFVPKLYVYTTTSVLGVWACWMGENSGNNMLISNGIFVITFIVAVVFTYMQKFDEEDSK